MVSQTSRTFRVFISSTFSDMKAERNALAHWVFPKLRALCESRGYKFQAVDLRWGVRDEAGADQQTVRICLEEIVRCQRLSPRPNFIVLLGDRYGWRPAPTLIPAAEMETLRAYLTPDDALLVSDWYRRDDNAVPPEYVLQPRRGSFAAYDAWDPVERRLRQALAIAAEAAGLSEVAARRYRASATELEVMKGAVETAGAREHVFAFFRSISNLDALKAALPGEPARAFVDSGPGGDCDEAAWEAQERLKATLKDRVGDANVWLYQAEWKNGALDLGKVVAELPSGLTPDLAAETDADAAAHRENWENLSRKIAADIASSFPVTANLCEAVWQRLSRVVAAAMDALDGLNRDPLNVERETHKDFGEERRRVFRGRAEPLRRIAEYLSTDRARPLVIHGRSGSGKSALMAHAVAEVRAAHPAAVIVERYIGATPASSEARSLLEYLCQEISRAFGADESPVGDYPKLVTELSKRLGLATAVRPVIVFLDALDQLGDSDDGRRVAWLPRELPPHVRIVVSTLDDEKYQGLGVLFPPLPPGIPRTAIMNMDDDGVALSSLTERDGREILAAWFAGEGEDNGRRRAPRTLTTWQRETVLAKFAVAADSSPLYLKLAFEESRRWHSYDGNDPAAALPVDVVELIRALYARLSASEHGARVVSHALGDLAAARYGLSDDEMLELLWKAPELKAEVKEHGRKHRHDLPDEITALPPIIWSRLYFDLEPYLTVRNVFGVPLHGFYHRQLREVAADDYLASNKDHVHGYLADCFAKRWQRSEIHALSEIAWQLSSAGRSAEAYTLLTSPRFIQAKCTTPELGIDDLLADLTRSAKEGERAERAILGLLLKGAWAEAATLRRHPQLSLQQIWNRIRWSDDLQRALGMSFDEVIDEARRNGEVVLKAEVPLQTTTGPSIQSFEIAKYPSAVAMSPLGLVVFHPDGWSLCDSSGYIRRRSDKPVGAVRELRANGTYLIALAGSVVLVWPALPDAPALRFSPGWAPTVTALASNADRLLVAGEGGQWVVYSLSGKPARKHDGTTSARATAAALASDATQWLIGTSEGHIYRYDAEGGQRLVKAAHPIRRLDLSSDGELAMVLGEDNQLSLLALNGEPVFRGILGHNVTDAAFEAGTRAVLATTDRGVILRLSEKASRWETTVLASTGIFSAWVRGFPGKSVITTYGDDGIFRFVAVEFDAPPALTANATPRTDAAVGLLPISDGTAVIACADGALWHFSSGPIPHCRQVSPGAGPLMMLRPLAPGGDEALLVFQGRAHSYLSRLHFSPTGVRNESLGPADSSSEYQVTLVGAAVSNGGRFAVTVSRTVEPPLRTRVAVFETTPWRRVRELWQDGWQDHPAVSDSGVVTWASSTGETWIVDVQAQSEVRCPLAGSMPLAFDSRGRMLLAVDGKWGAWLLKSPWGSESLQFLRPRVRAGTLTADGTMGMIVDDGGFLHLFDSGQTSRAVIGWRGGYPLGWVANACQFDPEHEQIAAVGSAGFQILRWR